jgi:putative addiction module component (TIGR02574 family)
MTKEQILSEAMALSRQERDELARDLWQGIAPGELSPEQLKELRRRIDAIDAGRTELIPVDQNHGRVATRFG